MGRVSLSSLFFAPHVYSSYGAFYFSAARDVGLVGISHPWIVGAKVACCCRLFHAKQITDANFYFIFLFLREPQLSWARTCKMLRVASVVGNDQ